jgi:hypothetical protein
MRANFLLGKFADTAAQLLLLVIQLKVQDGAPGALTREKKTDRYNRKRRRETVSVSSFSFEKIHHKGHEGTRRKNKA